MKRTGYTTMNAGLITLLDTMTAATRATRHDGYLNAYNKIIAVLSTHTVAVTLADIDHYLARDHSVRNNPWMSDYINNYTDAYYFMRDAIMTASR